MNVTTTELQQELAKQAAWKRYRDGLHKADSPTWKWGKCPSTEYRGIINELGSANYLGIPTEDLCLYSMNSADYSKPDAGIWDFKSGTKWTTYDVRKGVKYILWGSPVETDHEYVCIYPTCPYDSHKTLSGDVEIRGWSNTKDTKSYHRMGNAFYPKPINDLITIPWAVRNGL